MYFCRMPKGFQVVSSGVSVGFCLDLDQVVMGCLWVSFGIPIGFLCDSIGLPPGRLWESIGLATGGGGFRWDSNGMPIGFRSDPYAAFAGFLQLYFKIRMGDQFGY